MSLSRENSTVWEETDGMARFNSTTSSSSSRSSSPLSRTVSSCTLLRVDVSGEEEQTTTTGTGATATSSEEHDDGDDDDQEVCTRDEGSPASQVSLCSEDFCDHPSSPCTTPTSALAVTTPSTLVQFAPPPGFGDMVLKQAQERRHAQSQRKALWVATQQAELYALLPGELRLPSLIAESYRHEVMSIRRNRQHLTEVQIEDLLADTKRSYKGIFAEVQRAVRSNPPAQQAAELSVAQHRQNVAQSGVQCFAAMLPYSNGVCGAITDARRAQHSTTSGIPQHILLDDGFHNLHGTAPAASSNSYGSVPAAIKSPKGTAIGRTGRFIPVSMSAEHGKGDRVAMIRRKALAAKASPKPQQQHNYRTPTFANQRMPPSVSAAGQYRRGCSSAVEVSSSSAHQQSYRPTTALHVDPVASH